MAGDGEVDHLLPGLAIGARADDVPPERELEDTLAPADLVVVENLLSLPLNPAAADVVSAVLANRPSLLHHHDLAWQRPATIHFPPPPDRPHWRHVTINELSRRQLAARSVPATTIYNSFAIPDEARFEAALTTRGDRAEALRDLAGAGPEHPLLLQPTRAIPRKNIAGGLAVATELGATYWILGPDEDGFGPEVARILAPATTPVLRGIPDSLPSLSIDEAYAASDAVLLPSTWEGFGNPSLESVVHGRPLIIGPYPVARELAAFGFRWFGLHQGDELRAWWEGGDDTLLRHNLEVAATHFSLADLPARIAAVLPDH